MRAVTSSFKMLAGGRVTSGGMGIMEVGKVGTVMLGGLR